jgi:hypothetical protein
MTATRGSTILDEERLVQVVSANGPDRPELVDPEQVPLLDELAELDRRAARGELAVDDLIDRQAVVFDQLAGSLLLKSPRFQSYVKSISDKAAAVQFLLDAYLPANYPGPIERRYRLMYSGPQPPGFGQVKVASKDTGKLYALNGFLPQGGFASGRAEAAIGLLVRPTHPISRLTFEPSISYAFGHRADVATAQGKVNWVTSSGELSFVVDRVNPVTGAGEPFMHKSLPLWQQYTGTGTGYGWIRGRGQYPGANLGLQVIAGSGDLLAMWVVVRIDLAKQDYDPQFFSTGQAYVDCDIPLMWVTEVPLT